MVNRSELVICKKPKRLPGTFANLLLLVICWLLQFSLFAQSTNTYRWFDPATSAYPVIGGRGWHTDLKSPYDRLPARAEKSLTNLNVYNIAHSTAGEYIDFKTSSTSIVVQYKVAFDFAMPHMPATGVSGLDLYARDIHGNWQLAKGDYKFDSVCEYKFTNLSLSSKEEEFRLYLPLYNSVSWLKIGVPTDASFTALPISNEQPIVVYGTSIAQGACASRPGLAWTNILGRKLDRNIINLGFSGNGRLEESVIDLIAELDAKLYVLDCMPNLIRSKFTKEETQKRIWQSVNKLQQKHPGVPILLTEHSCGLPGTLMDTTFLYQYKDISNTLAQSFDSMQKSGIKNIFLLTDEAIGFDEECTVDRTHANDLGMMKYANAYESIIQKIFKEEKGTISTTIPIRQRRDNMVYDFIQRHEAVLKTVKEKQPRLVLMGNSITHYWGGDPVAPIRRGQTSWEKYIEPYNAVNLGFGWDRIENVLWRVYHGELDGYKADKILINTGTNNLALNNDDEIIAGLKNLIEAVHQRQPAAKILLSGLYPRRDMEKRIAGLNKKIAALKLKIPVIHINPGTVLLKQNGLVDETLFTDGLHPNENGYEKVGIAISRVLK